MRGWLFGLACLVLAAAGPATAHGPTIEITAAGFEPALLNLFEGTTVHFSNTLAVPQVVVVSGESGTVTSPPIDKAGEGWHYTFEKGGAHAIHLQQRTAATMRVVVVEKAAP